MILFAVIYTGLWVFIASDPSPVAWVIAMLAFSYTILGYLYLELTFFEMVYSAAHVPPAPGKQLAEPPVAQAHQAPDAHEVYQRMQSAAKEWGTDKKGKGR
jgi:hypothetical protein